MLRLAPFALIGLLMAFAVGSTLSAVARSQGKPFVVLELFTSEGCSSCPAADHLLGELSRDAREQGQPIYALAFHVDYWNQLGWKDRFSDPSFTRRQQAYVSALGLGSAYTPQMVVNGREEFVGSDASRARRSIRNALAAQAGTRVTLQVGPPAQGRLPVEFSVGGSSPEVLNLALVERGLATQVLNGENAGRKLLHENVVRAFETFSLGVERKGSLEILLPKSLHLENASLVGYVQEPETLAIVGATAVELR